MHQNGAEVPTRSRKSEGLIVTQQPRQEQWSIQIFGLTRHLRPNLLREIGRKEARFLNARIVLHLHYVVVHISKSEGHPVTDEREQHHRCQPEVSVSLLRGRRLGRGRHRKVDRSEPGELGNSTSLYRRPWVTKSIFGNDRNVKTTARGSCPRAQKKAGAANKLAAPWLCTLPLSTTPNLHDLPPIARPGSSGPLLQRPQGH